MKIASTVAIITGGTAIGAAAAIAASAALGLGVSASASTDSSGPAATTSLATQDPVPVFPRNADGLTYGTIAGVNNVDDMPDLVSIWVDEDTIGYVPRDVLFPSTPAQARALTSSGERADNTVTAFKSDGETVIGEVFLGTPVEAPASR